MFHEDHRKPTSFGTMDHPSDPHGPLRKVKVVSWCFGRLTVLYGFMRKEFLMYRTGPGWNGVFGEHGNPRTKMVVFPMPCLFSGV